MMERTAGLVGNSEARYESDRPEGRERPRGPIGQQQSVLCLALDTSSPTMTVAALRSGELLGERSVKGERNHSVHLLPNVQELLRSLGLQPRELGAIAVGAGPGSYTGVRIAVSVAKTLAWSLRVPLVGVSSLAALAQGASRRLDTGEAEAPAAAGRRWFVPLLDARRGQAFAAVYEGREGSGDRLVALAADGVRLVRGWADELLQRAADEGAAVVFCGETERFEGMLPEAAAASPAGGARQIVLPHALAAQDIGALAFPKLLNGELEDVHTFVPNYTQLAEAEVKLLAKLKQGD